MPERFASDAAACRRHQRATVFLGLVGAGLLAVPAAIGPAPRLVWNASASVPTGLYAIAPGAEPERGLTVLAWLPPRARLIAAQRRYLPSNVPLLKPVAAAAGDRVCASRFGVTIGTGPAVPRLAADHAGRALPAWEGCVTLGRDQIFLLAPARSDSFDSRYFGPVDRHYVLGTARLIWAR